MPRRTLQRLVVGLCALVPILFVAGLWLGGHPRSLPAPLRDVFVDDHVRTLDDGLDIIEQDYYRRVKRSQLVDDSLAGAVSKLHDRFSTYLSPRDYQRFQASSHGEFSGVGMEVTQVSDGLKLTRVFPNSPAKRGGLRVGDHIVAVNGHSLAGRTSARSTELIRGRPGTYVKLTLERAGAKRRTLRLRRERVEAPSVTSSLRTVKGRRLGVVALSGFTAGAHGEVRAAVDRMLERGAKGIVLDLRGNGGGLLDEAVLTASVFISEGTIVSTDGRSRPRKVYRATGGAIRRSIPVDVLVDEGSASASEIVTAAIRDRGRGKVVGTRTFGKGVFQEVRELPNGGALDITVGEYFTPSGENLGGGGTRRGAGVTPGVRASDDPDTPADEALDAALRELVG
ncbi:MAG: carboxyl-terminal processing protease [Solirubrobacteraceae bacterium]|jgi:carboxyl-terminal processing protease|nr:carboxyl-terminal processing protease [Solirubrobacteraceae bacterium]